MFKFILYPFSFLYRTITDIRNFLYDTGFFKSKKFDLPIISVGNLTMGGTGKSPHIIYLIELLKNRYKVAVLSRGYGRKTKGFLLADKNSNAKKIGDEPIQFYKRYGAEISVAVCENRVVGVTELLNKINPEVILLDDAFQHRKIIPSLSVLLTEYGSLYTRDHVVPMGHLRESFKGYKRANLVIVTKCPENLSETEKQRIKEELNLDKQQELFFSSIQYSNKLLSREKTVETAEMKNKNILLITGIADPQPFYEYIKNYSDQIVHLKYPDHHNFVKKDINKILSVYGSLGNNKIMITTEKDYMRLEKEDLLGKELFYQQIITKIENQNRFEKIILDSLTKNK